MSRLGINALLGDDRTLAEMLDSFDPVTADEVRAEAEMCSGILRRLRSPERRWRLEDSNRCYLRGSRKGGR